MNTYQNIPLKLLYFPHREIHQTCLRNVWPSLPSWDLICGRGIYFIWVFGKEIWGTQKTSTCLVLWNISQLCGSDGKESKGEAEVREWKSLAASWYCYVFHTYSETSPLSPSDSRGTWETLPFAPELAQQLSSSKSYARYWIYLATQRGCIAHTGLW